MVLLQNPNDYLDLLLLRLRAFYNSFFLDHLTILCIVITDCYVFVKLDIPIYFECKQNMNHLPTNLVFR